MLYRSIFDVVRDFLHEEALSDEKVLGRYLKPDLLIVDDMGMKQLPKRSGEYLFEIIMRRYETRSTMMTSNRPLEDWGKLVGDVPTPRRSSTASCTTRRSSRSPVKVTACETGRPTAVPRTSTRGSRRRVKTSHSARRVR